MTRLTGLRRAVLPQDTRPLPEPETLLEQTVRVPMTAVDRRRVRRRLNAPDGTELQLAFPTGTVLTPGSVLGEVDGVTYLVEAAAEDVATVRPNSLPEAVAVAHAVGNLHRDFVACQDEESTFLVLWDAPMELLLSRLGVPFVREQRPFHGRPSWEHEG